MAPTTSLTPLSLALRLMLLALLAPPLWGCHLIFPFHREAADAPLPDGGARDARGGDATADGQGHDLFPADAGLDRGAGPVVGNPKGPLCIGALQVAIFSVQLSDPAGGSVMDKWSAPDGSIKLLGLGNAEYKPPADYAMLCPRKIVVVATSSATGLKASYTWQLNVTRAADFNRDGAVDGDDFLIYQNELSTKCCSTGSNTCKADANGDCAVDGSDFNIWQAEQGSTGCTCP